MVHVRKCPLGKGMRGNPTTEFYHDDKPQIYCYGRIDLRTDEYLEQCKLCKDFVYGAQFEEDFQNHLKSMED